MAVAGVGRASGKVRKSVSHFRLRCRGPLGRHGGAASEFGLRGSDLLPLPPETDPDGPISHQELVPTESRVWIDFERATLVEERSDETLRFEAAVDPSPGAVGQETPGVVDHRDWDFEHIWMAALACVGLVSQSPRMARGGSRGEVSSRETPMTAAPQLTVAAEDCASPRKGWCAVSVPRTSSAESRLAKGSPGCCAKWRCRV